MKNIFDILTSRARVMILRTLYFQEQAIPLRHLSSISNLPIFSVQNAVKPLLEEKLISKADKDNNVLFELNRKHSLYDILAQFFIIEMNARSCFDAKLLYQKANSALEFANAANIIFRHAKLKRTSK